MTNEEILNGNTLIAVFMGGEFRTDLPFTYTKEGWVNTPANDNMQIAQNYDLKYHSSWDWLMPVVEKIEDLDDKFYFVKIHSGGCFIHPINNTKAYNVKQYQAGKSKIEMVYATVVEFIEWYNKHQIKKIRQ